MGIGEGSRSKLTVPALVPTRRWNRESEVAVIARQSGCVRGEREGVVDDFEGSYSEEYSMTVRSMDQNS